MFLSPFLYLNLVVPKRFKKDMSWDEGKWLKLEENGSSKILNSVERCVYKIPYF